MNSVITDAKVTTMIAEELRIEWAELTPITISQIEHKNTRAFLQVLNNNERPIDTHVYLCSDFRNEILRSLLSQIPGVATYNNAGNVIYNPVDKPTVVIAHGCENNSACGAVGYAKKHGKDAEPELPDMAALVDGNPAQNAKNQLDKVKPGFRAGVLYFDHEKGRLRDVSDLGNARSGSREKILQEMGPCLENWYTRTDIQEFGVGQDPELIFLNNIHSPPTGFKAFQVDLQWNAFEGIIRDSLCYAMSHALVKNGTSFQNTYSTIFGFRTGRDLPRGLDSFLNGADRKLVQSYMYRGGSVYLAIVGDTPSQKELFQLTPK